MKYRSKQRTLIDNVILTGYYPPPRGGYSTKAEADMEGGGLDCLGRPLRTLESYLNDPETAEYVSIAVDKRLIPLKSVVNIEGHGKVTFVACDVGSAIKGKHIDICCDNRKSSYAVTNKQGVKIWIVGKVTEF